MVVPGVELHWHKNRSFCQIYQPKKDKIVAWKYIADGMKFKESYFSKLDKIDKADYNKY